MVFFYLPRICNHCVNAGCVAACPSGAIYKRGEDGIVLISQDKCRGWRMCVSGCPYKKTYYTWSSGKSEKCILCYPRQESGQAPACFHACVGRIRYLGVLLYDADRIEAAAAEPDERLVEAQREMILDPFDPEVVAEARRCGIAEQVLEAARRSPVYRLVKEWRLALPLHPEFRTLPMLFYVPPLLPVLSVAGQGNHPAGGGHLQLSRKCPPAAALPGGALRRRERGGGPLGLPQADGRALAAAGRDRGRPGRGDSWRRHWPRREWMPIRPRPFTG